MTQEVKIPPLVEFAGLPAAGKTTATRVLHAYLTDRGYRCRVVPEAAANSPLPSLKRSWLFNAWTLCHTVCDVLKESGSESNVVLIDRGFVDSLGWIEWFHMRQDIRSDTARMLQKLATESQWFSQLRITFLLGVSYEVALRRRHGEAGRIVNPETYAQLDAAYENVRNRMREPGTDFIRIIDTDRLTVAQVHDRVLREVRKLGIFGDAIA